MDTQLRKGSLELSILAILDHQEDYGYNLGKFFSESLDIKEGTLYLILQRLEKTGDLESYLLNQESGKKRKYYRLSNQGRDKLENLKNEWKIINEFVDNCITEGMNHE